MKNANEYYRLPPASASKKKTNVPRAESAFDTVNRNIAMNGEMITMAISMNEHTSCGFIMAGSFCEKRNQSEGIFFGFF